MKWEPDNRICLRLGRITEVVRAELECSASLVELGARLAEVPGTVVLASGGEQDCARYHIIGACPWLEVRARGRQVEIKIDGQAFRFEADPFEVIRWIINTCSVPQYLHQAPFCAGLMGYLAYDLKDLIEDLPGTSVDDLGLPHLLFYSPAVAVVHDRMNGKTTAYGLQRDTGEDVRGKLLEIKRIFSSPLPSPAPWESSAQGFESSFDRLDYLAAVSRTREYIAAGDVYQVNLSQRFSIRFDGDPYRLFIRLFQMNPAPFFAFINAGDYQIVSTSPERFLLRKGDRVETRPIKGTRPRSSDSGLDAAYRKQLLESPKDAAELAMIVDLLRNDIGKVCRAGSVRVAEHKRIEAYSNVYHLVSVVEGELEESKDAIDLVRATFPGGSITGCPKVRAMEIIDELEPCRRHVYTGSIGYFSFHDTLDLSIAIRTATVLGNRLIFSVGGGIVYDSDPEAEYQETLDKGRTLMEAIGGFQQESGYGRIWFNGRITDTDKARVPVTSLGLQYGFGFFETIRSLAGRQALLGDHLARFHRSWKELFRLPGPDVDWQAVIKQVLEANGLGNSSARLKIMAAFGTRHRPPFDYNLVVSAKPYVHRLKALGVAGLDLVTYPLARQSPLAAHKSLNYLYYHKAGDWARKQGGHEALVLNPDGTVSETNTANLLLVYGNTLIRPISTAALPGVMTACVTRLLAGRGYDIQQKTVRHRDLRSAEGVFLTNALMGLVPVASLDGDQLAEKDTLPWRRINNEIIGPGWDE